MIEKLFDSTRQFAVSKSEEQFRVVTLVAVNANVLKIEINDVLD